MALRGRSSALTSTSSGATKGGNTISITNDGGDLRALEIVADMDAVSPFVGIFVDVDCDPVYDAFHVLVVVGQSLNLLPDQTAGRSHALARLHEVE